MIDYKKMFDLGGKVAVVTGGAGLLGSEFCKGLAAYNANVVISDISKENIGKLANTMNKDYPDKAMPLETDITDEGSVREGIQKIVDKFGKIDILVNCAYPRNKDYGKKFEEVKLESWSENIDMNLSGVFLMTQLAVEHMKKRKSGSVVNIGSIYGMVGPDFGIYDGTEWTNPVEYSVVKGGVINLTRYLATYLASYGIRVNCISPGGIYNNDSKIFLERYAKKTPLGRKAMADEMVGGLVYLASDASTYVTGHNLVIDGGLTIW
ncbi:MAG: oxidoreductase [Candidatus Paceibacterota bacterium]|jgi:NAD(P)-dependent dehydrogenase (short-subunit alcohol dehydrogenase family)